MRAGKTGVPVKTGRVGVNPLAANGTTTPGALGTKNGAPAVLIVLTVPDGSSKKAAAHRVGAGGRGCATKLTGTRSKTWEKIQAKRQWQS